MLNVINTVYYFTAVSINEIISGVEYNSYPNPVIDKINVTFSEAIHPVKIEAYNNAGQSILTTFEQSNSLKLTADLSQLASGFYILRIHAEDGSNYDLKVIKD